MAADGTNPPIENEANEYIIKNFLTLQIVSIQRKVKVKNIDSKTIDNWKSLYYFNLY